MIHVVLYIFIGFFMVACSSSTSNNQPTLHPEAENAKIRQIQLPLTSYTNGERFSWNYDNFYYGEGVILKTYKKGDVICRLVDEIVYQPQQQFKLISGYCLDDDKIWK